MATFEKRLMRLLKEAGWYKDRQGRTSHQQWRHPDRGEFDLTVPSKIKNRHTASHILKQAGLPKEF